MLQNRNFWIQTTDDAWAHENEEFVDEDDSSGCAVLDLEADGSYGLSLSATTTEVADNDPPDASASDAAEVSFHEKNISFTMITKSMILLLYSPLHSWQF